MRAEVVHNDMDFPVRMVADYPVHEIEELYPSSSLVVCGYDLTGGCFQSVVHTSDLIPDIVNPGANPGHLLATKSPGHASRSPQIQ